MITAEVQRTLVKSPPELWSELSDATSLARHLNGLGEIRITRSEPEQIVEWEAEDTSGTIELKPSGWGTKVTLSLRRALPAPTAPEPEPEPVLEITPRPTWSEPMVIVEVRPEPPPEPAEEIVTEPEPRRGFLARLFKRRPALEVSDTPKNEPEVQPEPESEPQVQALALPQLTYPPAPPDPVTETQPRSDLSVELAEIEAQMERDSTELLTGVLDRLGAAHHRPFSRA